jgi:hypothetical protein
MSGPSCRVLPRRRSTRGSSSSLRTIVQVVVALILVLPALIEGRGDDGPAGRWTDPVAASSSEERERPPRQRRPGTGAPKGEPRLCTAVQAYADLGPGPHELTNVTFEELMQFGRGSDLGLAETLRARDRERHEVHRVLAELVGGLDTGADDRRSELLHRGAEMFAELSAIADDVLAGRTVHVGRLNTTLIPAAHLEQMRPELLAWGTSICPDLEAPGP